METIVDELIEKTEEDLQYALTGIRANSTIECDRNVAESAMALSKTLLNLLEYKRKRSLIDE